MESREPRQNAKEGVDGALVPSPLLESPDARFWRRSATIGAFAALLAMQAILLRGSWTSWDLRLWDGSWYFSWGRDIATRFSFPSLENAPVYCAYYAVFHRLFGDPFVVYYAHRITMLFGISVLAFSFYRRLLSPAVALSVSAYLIVLIPTEGLATYAVRPFVVIPLLLACHAAVRDSPWADLVVVGCFSLAAGVRPEFSIAVPLLGALLWFRPNRGPDSQGRCQIARWTTAGFIVIASVVLVTRTAGPGPRSLLAFGQHYGLGYTQRHPSISNQDPWLNWQSYLRSSFGDAKSVAAAAESNPRAFIEHVAWNASILPAAIDRSLQPGLLGRPPAGAPGFSALAVVLASCLAGILLARRRGLRLGVALHRYGRLCVVLGAMLVPVVLAALVFYPNPVHMGPLRVVVLLAAGIVLQLATGGRLGGRRHAIAVGLVALAGLVLMPSPFDGPSTRAVLPIVRALAALPIDGSYGLVADSATSFCAYADHENCRAIEILWRDGQLPQPAAFVDEQDVRVIIVSPRMMANLSADWQTFIQQILVSGEEAGWRVAGRSRRFVALWRPSSRAATPATGGPRGTRSVPTLASNSTLARGQ